MRGDLERSKSGKTSREGRESRRQAWEDERGRRKTAGLLADKRISVHDESSILKKAFACERRSTMQASVYTVWQQFAGVVKQIVPGLHGHRCKTLVWLVLGIMLAKSVASAPMAEVLRRVRGTQASSQERTISRFLANEAIEPQKLWQSFLPVLLAGWAKQPEVTFVVDTTPLGTWAILVSFGILHHSRVWPLGWRVMPAQQSWEAGQYD